MSSNGLKPQNFLHKVFEQLPRVVFKQVFEQLPKVVFKRLNSSQSMCSNRVFERCLNVNPTSLMDTSTHALGCEWTRAHTYLTTPDAHATLWNVSRSVVGVSHSGTDPLCTLEPAGWTPARLRVELQVVWSVVV